jgi:prenylcysteine oxidase / farnesylcysteine lyase
VILAAPFHQTGISIPSELAEQIPPQPYVHLHVTLLTTRDNQMKAEYFGLSSGDYVPRTILTTSQGMQSGGVDTEFNSLSYHGRVRKANETGHWIDQEEWNVKIFSKQRISDEWLAKAFHHVGWVYRKEVGCSRIVFVFLTQMWSVECVPSVATHCQVSSGQD